MLQYYKSNSYISFFMFAGFVITWSRQYLMIKFIFNGILKHLKNNTENYGGFSPRAMLWIVPECKNYCSSVWQPSKTYKKKKFKEAGPVSFEHKFDLSWVHVI